MLHQRQQAWYVALYRAAAGAVSQIFIIQIRRLKCKLSSVVHPGHCQHPARPHQEVCQLLRRREPHYFQHRIGTATAGQSVYIFDQIGRRAVKRNCPQASSHRPALRHQVDRQDLPGTHLAQTDNRQQPYRPAADHRIAAPRARPGHIGAEPAGGEYIA